jgi:hypothetical protein
MIQNKILLALLLLLSSPIARAQSQSLNGLWCSEDSTRIYKIQETKNGYEAILFSSSRKNEKPGVVILKDVKFKKNKSRYEGIIFAVDDNMATSANITLSGNIMKLKLQRFFVTHETIRWYKVNASAQ